MINKLYYLTKVSLMRKIKTKWFVIANVILALLIVGITNIDSIVKFFGGDFDEKTKIYVVDNTNVTYDLLKSNIEKYEKSLLDSVSFDINKSNKSEDKLKKKIKDNDKTYAIIINSDESNVIDATIISNAYIDTIPSQILTQAINQTKTSIALNELNLSEEDINKIYQNVKINRVILDKEKKSEDENMETIISTVFPIFILPFFMLTVFLVQMIGSEINDEKTTRGMEIIISNVSPKAHFFSKVLAGNIFVIMQSVIIFIYACIGLLIRNLSGSSNITNMFDGAFTGIIDSVMTTEFISKMVYILPLTLFLMFLTFIAYSLLAGILASMTTNAEDFNQLQTPIMVISVIGYYLAMMAGVFKGALFIRILSYVPLMSAILAPSLLVIGQIGIIDIIISIVLTLLLNYLLIKYGIKVYKVGILNYSSKNLWKKMFKALKN